MTNRILEHIHIPRDKITPAFLRRFQRHYTTPDDGCWTWDGWARNGYGYIYIGKQKYRAHRVMWAIRFGDIPEGMCVLHKCDNPRCVRPSHLWLGTQLENIEDMLVKGRQKGEKKQRRQLGIS